LQDDVWISPAELNTHLIPALEGGQENIFTISKANRLTGRRVEIFSKYLQYLSGMRFIIEDQNAVFGKNETSLVS